MKEAVVAILKKENKILCITRKDNHEDWGIPGGAVEPNEDINDAVVREVLEETGVLMTNYELIDCRFDNDRLTYLFVANDYLENYALIDPKETALIGWFEPAKTFEGSFGKYNKKVSKLFL